MKDQLKRYGWIGALALALMMALSSVIGSYGGVAPGAGGVVRPSEQYRVFILTPGGGWESTTSGAAAPAKVEYTTNDIDMYHTDFDSTSIEYGQWTIYFPPDFGGFSETTTIDFMVAWTTAGGAAAETVSFKLQGIAYADGDAIDASWGTAAEVNDTWIGSNKMHYTTWSSAVTLAGTPTAGGGQVAQIRFYRDPTDSGDNMTTGSADARSIMTTVRFKGF